MKLILGFSIPLLFGNLFQQFYSMVDTMIVGRVLGSNALAAVGSAYTLMTFLTSIFLGLHRLHHVPHHRLLPWPLQRLCHPGGAALRQQGL